MIGQAFAIGGLMWAFASVPLAPGQERMHPLGIVLGPIVIVAFGTAVLVNLWDLALRPFRRRRGGGAGHANEPGQKRIGAACPWLGRREVSEERGRRRIG